MYLKGSDNDQREVLATTMPLSSSVLRQKPTGLPLIAGAAPGPLDGSTSLGNIEVRLDAIEHSTAPPSVPQIPGVLR